MILLLPKVIIYTGHIARYHKHIQNIGNEVYNTEARTEKCKHASFFMYTEQHI